MASSLQETVARQREALAELMRAPLAALAERCAAVWPNRTELDRVLSEALAALPHCKYLYAMDTHAIQISDNVSHDGLVLKHFGRDRSHRPYMCDVVPCVDFLLSEAYISLRAHRPSLTVVQLVRRDGRAVGFIGVDFDLRNLPLTRELYEEPGHWRQIKGDPVIRGQVFYQTRVESPLDRHMEAVLGLMDELIEDHGVFHCKIHFSSSRATIWLLDDPYRYRILDYEALIDPDVCLAYPRRDYPAAAVLPASAVRPVLQTFSALRFVDETFYLRSGSLNIFNGMVSLTFSCDGSHYMRYDEFLAKDVSFWTGAAA
jgi:hypothetical protein